MLPSARAVWATTTDPALQGHPGRPRALNLHLTGRQVEGVRAALWAPPTTALDEPLIDPGRRITTKPARRLPGQSPEDAAEAGDERGKLVLRGLDPALAPNGSSGDRRPRPFGEHPQDGHLGFRVSGEGALLPEESDRLPVEHEQRLRRGLVA